MLNFLLVSEILIAKNVSFPGSTALFAARKMTHLWRT